MQITLGHSSSTLLKHCAARKIDCDIRLPASTLSSLSPSAALPLEREPAAPLPPPATKAATSPSPSPQPTRETTTIATVCNITSSSRRHSRCSSMQSEAPTCSKVPTVDVGGLGAHHAEEPCQQEWERVTRELEQAFSDIGCAYLTGHGVPDHLINEMLSTGVAFFKQQEEVKNRWSKDTNMHGYLSINSERYAGAGPELHESFLFKPDSYNSCDEEAPPFMTPLMTVHEFCLTLSRRLMTCLALSVGKNRDHFVNMHLDSGTKNSLSTYRLNYYPLASGGREDTTGFGAHVDYSTITLIYSNDSEGLQVRDSAGRWIDVKCVPGTIILLAGEFLHFHSYKRFRPAMHRVVLPSEHQPRRPHRCTLIWFEHADSHQPMWPTSEDPTQPAPPGVKDFLMEKTTTAVKAVSRN
ncbi:uncharacterized protein LOC135100015 [Scylla paramamosain]|uniref:uncharacterized protein LOC135100015 n=1 Tax=Scylla paramamosain TaxID=85552 RepID=UPI0030827C68